MNKIFIALLGIAFAGTSFSQEIIIPELVGGSYSTRGSDNNNGTASPGGRNWLHESGTFPTNVWMSAGSGSFSRGASPNNMYLTWMADMRGRYRNYANVNDSRLQNDNTYITMANDEIQITSGALEALALWHSRGNQRVGSLFLTGGGTWRGASGYAGMAFTRAGAVSLENVSVYAGGSSGGSYVPGIHFSTTGAVTLDLESDDMIVAGESRDPRTTTGGGTFNGASGLEAGDGTRFGGTGAVTINGGNFYAITEQNNSMDYTEFDTVSHRHWVQAGSGLWFGSVGSGATITGTKAYAGTQNGNVTVGGPESEASVIAGSGAFFRSDVGDVTISDSTFVGGRNNGSASAVIGGYYDDVTLDPVSSDADSFANAMGGIGVNIQNSGTATLTDVIATGDRAGSATANGTNSNATATGGAGVYKASGTMTINGGTYTGGNGGNANSFNGYANAYGGAGVLMLGGTLNINGGTFSGGEGGRVNGIRQWGNAAIWVVDTTLNISETHSDTLLDGDIYFNSDANNFNMNINAGTITGDIVKWGGGTSTVRVSTNANYSGTFALLEGTIDAELSSPEQGRFFSDVYVGDGTFNFEGSAPLITPEDSRFILGNTTSILNFSNGAELGDGTSIDLGYGTVTSGADLVMGKDSSVSFAYDSVSGTRGLLDVTGALVITNEASIILSGISATPSGDVQVVTAGSLIGIAESNVYDIVKVDFGWLTKNDTNALDLTGGIKLGYEYNSLTNTSLSDLDNDALVYVDGVIQGLSTTNFFELNAGGEANGDKMIRYGMSQIPDASEAAFQVNQQVNEQIAARGTEFRSMNGFASSKPRFETSPTGVAGPKTEEEKTMQGWVRVYGSKGNRDADGNFSEYDSTSWGTVIGVDKSFGNLLIGLAGGYGRTDLDAGAAYTADVNTYHGSLYSTFGGESLFVDLALSYGWASTDEENLVSGDGEFDSQLYSFYVGAGYAFDLGEKFALTPEASLLASFYDQEGYDRTGGILDGTVEDYDTSSYLGSIGVSLATQHQIDWLNRGIAYIPEVRAHYIREFNADPDDFTYIIGGSPTPFAVRPRDENLFRLGFGFDMWSWKYQNTKFEIDYDGLFSDTYWEHVVSGKVTWRF